MEPRLPLCPRPLLSAAEPSHKGLLVFVFALLLQCVVKPGSTVASLIHGFTVFLLFFLLHVCYDSCIDQMVRNFNILLMKQSVPILTSLKINSKLLCYFRGYCDNLYLLVLRVPPMLSFDIDLYCSSCFPNVPLFFITLAHSCCLGLFEEDELISLCRT